MYTGPLFIASDHGGYQLKRRLVRYIQNELEREVTDLGAHEYVEADDYTDYTIPLTEQVLASQGRGIVICRSGIGVSIACNKTPGIRAGLGYNIAVAETMMQDNNTNILALASDHLSEEFAMAIVKKWLESEFSNAERHVRRLGKVAELEK